MFVILHIESPCLSVSSSICHIFDKIAGVLKRFQGVPPPPLTDKIRKVVFDVLPYHT